MYVAVSEKLGRINATTTHHQKMVSRASIHITGDDPVSAPAGWLAGSLAEVSLCEQLLVGCSGLDLLTEISPGESLVGGRVIV